MKPFFPFLFFVVVLGVSGCSSQNSSSPPVVGPHAVVQAENNDFLSQKSFDPWVLSTTDPTQPLPAYLPSGAIGSICGAVGAPETVYEGGHYDKNGVIISTQSGLVPLAPAAADYKQTLNLQTGVLSTVSETSSTVAKSSLDWPDFWKHSDIVIGGDPEAQQVTHAELFDLCGSLAPGSSNSIPPMGLSSDVYLGHIFWDAEIWMLPAILPQHPELARSIIDYRFERLPAAKSLAKSHGFKGAEFPWESAATGFEQAPQEFSQERHITADIAYAAWQYYLWTGDKAYLDREGWPLLSSTADYWVSRVSKSADGRYHIENVIGPDENAGVVSDDAWTNAVVRYNLLAATEAAELTGHAVNPAWTIIAKNIVQPFDQKSEIYLEYPAMNVDRSQAKQADTQMLIYPLNLPMSKVAAANTLNYYLKHTITVGPAMTSSINAVVAARLGNQQLSLNLYRDSYRPFMRGPWDAFSEKRTKSDVYFTTGMGGNLQVVLYGFAGINVAPKGKVGEGHLIAASSDASLYADPHLPPGWSGLTLDGIKFCGATYNLQISSDSTIKAVKVV